VHTGQFTFFCPVVLRARFHHHELKRKQSLLASSKSVLYIIVDYLCVLSNLAEGIDMPEYRKLIDTPPIILHRKDIEGLARFFEPPVDERGSASFSFSSGDLTFSANSFEELLQHELPPVVESLAFTFHNYDRKHGISLNIHKSFGHYYIYALDETWFKGKIQQLNEFLGSRRPWYLPISRIWLSALLGGFDMIVMAILSFFVFQHSILGMCLAGALLIVCIWLGYALAAAKVLPQSKIILQESKNKLSKEILLSIATILLFIATALEVILKLIEFHAK
jgi:hypothetical protein